MKTSMILWLRCCFSVLLLALLCGCWDRIEIEDRATVLGIAIDQADEKTAARFARDITHTQKAFPSEDQEMIKLSVQIAVPGRLPLGPGGGAGSDSGGAQSVWVLDSYGHTVDDAWQNLQQQLSSDLFFGHLRVIIIQEALAKRGVADLNDFLHRNTDVRRAAWMVVSKGEAAKHLEAAPELERIPTLYLLYTLDTAVGSGKYPEDLLGIFWSKISSLGQDAFLPYITLMEKNNIEISGSAYFTDDKMQGVTEPVEIGYYMDILGINPSGYAMLTKLPEEQAMVMFRPHKRKSQIHSRIKNGRPEITVNLHIEGDIREKTGSFINLNSPQVIKKLEQTISQTAEQGYYDLLAKTQKHGSDIFGFGEHIRGKHPGFWNREVKTKEKWQEMYKELQVEFQLNVDTRRVGMKSR